MTDTLPPPVVNGHAKPQVSLLKFAPEQPEAPAVEAVDRPDNPLADWLTVPDVPVLPAWARSAASLKANTVAFGRLCAWHARYHLLRAPKYAFRLAWLAVKGLWRGARGLWPTLAAQDQSAAVKALRAQVKAKPDDVDLAVRYALLHRERTLARRWRWGAAPPRLPPRRWAGGWRRRCCRPAWWRPRRSRSPTSAAERTCSCSTTRPRRCGST
jgi:S-DNA-T family DNA segregation ATPase FtsK/SpoIIIE